MKSLYFDVNIICFLQCGDGSEVPEHWSGGTTESPPDHEGRHLWRPPAPGQQPTAGGGGPDVQSHLDKTGTLLSHTLIKQVLVH